MASSPNEISDQGFQDQKISAIQNLLQEIPEPNGLLRHLMSVLHKIESLSSTIVTQVFIVYQIA